MPLGNKKTLAKKAAGNVLLKLLQDADARSCSSASTIHTSRRAISSRSSTVTTGAAETILMIADTPELVKPLADTVLARPAMRTPPCSFPSVFLRP